VSVPSAGSIEASGDYPMGVVHAWPRPRPDTCHLGLHSWPPSGAFATEGT
jgi:hypothetical protein